MTNHMAHQRVGEIQALIEVSRLITVVDLNKVLSETLAIVANAVGANKGSLLLLDEDNRPYERFITQRDMPPEVSHIVVSRVLEEGLAGWCVREKRGAIVADTEKDTRWLIFDDDLQTDVRSVICVPFIFEDNVHAVMTLVNDRADHFTRQDLQLATAIANQASAAIRNAHLFDNIQSQQRQMEIILENAGEVMFMLDHNLCFIRANRHATELVGIDREDLLDMHLNEVDSVIFRQLASILESLGKRQTAQVFEVHDELGQQDYSINVAMVDMESEAGYVVVMHNITVIKDLDRLKSHMMRMASHDLKNPISIIWGYVELLRVDIQNDVVPDIQLVEGIVRALTRMDELIEELLDTDRLERESRFRDSIVKPNLIIEQSLQEVIDNLQRKRLHLVENYPFELPSLQGDPTQLRQAMVNLLSNAIKYTPEGGTITITGKADDESFQYSVEDNGIGIPKALQDGIFSQLYRAERPEIEGIEGTGVGLSLVREIIHRHGGDVWFKSEEGIGSVFGFWIPL